MEYKLIYIDDDIDHASIYKDGLTTNKSIKIDVIKADEFEKQLKEILKLKNQFDGIILDLKLDENQEGLRKAFYTAPALAQQFRSKSIDKRSGFKKEFPIFLITSKDKLIKYYESDKSSHDLFDKCFIKEYDFGIKGKIFENEIHSFISAYKLIAISKKYESILGVEKLESTIKNRIFEVPFNDSLVSDKAKFIYKNLIKRSGILIEERILGARLGIDIENSPDWDKLKRKLKNMRYVGIYGDAYERWWNYKITDWWKDNISPRVLATIKAKDRIELLKKKLRYKKLVAAKPIAKTTSDRFWTICQKLKLPLDPKDGFKLRRYNEKTWQDAQYFSLQAFLDGKVEHKEIHPSEIERFREIKRRLTK